jgi:hypothetical protein
LEGKSEEVLIKGRMLRDVERIGKEKGRRKVERKVGMWRKGCSKLKR